MGAGILLVAGSALAVQHLFRVEQSWFNKPNPPVTTKGGGAGLYQAYLQPYVTITMMGTYYAYPAPLAEVQAGNPIGGAFTLPQSFFQYSGEFEITPKTGWAGYTTITVSNYYAGPGKFKANNVHTGSTPTRLVFETTGTPNGAINPIPNLGTGNPKTPTETWGGYYDFGRVGSINVTPGPNRFGGTMKTFYKPSAYWYQYVTYFTPALYKGYAHFEHLQNGVHDVTPNAWESNIGDVTAVYRLTRFLLNDCTGAPLVCTGTGAHHQPATARATTPRTPYGVQPTVNGGMLGGGGKNGPASYLTQVQQYVNTIHPWTTGYARVDNAIGSPSIISPRSTGYDISLGGVERLEIPHVDWNQQWNKTINTLTTTTTTWMQHLYGVRRVVSMVRPRLIHTYLVPLDPTTDPITETWPVARMWRMKVYFVPEPAGMLLLGTGIVALLGVSRMRRR
jgi:hypothetical protein